MMQSNIVEKQLNIYIDENIAPQMAEAFDIVQSHLNLEEKKTIRVFSIKNKFYEGVLDEEWIPVVGAENGIVITQDRKIQQTKFQRDLYMQHGVGIIFLKCGKDGMTFWNMFKHLVKYWDEIKSIARKNKPPFAFRQPGSDKNFVEWTIDE